MSCRRRWKVKMVANVTISSPDEPFFLLKAVSNFNRHQNSSRLTGFQIFLSVSPLLRLFFSSLPSPLSLSLVFLFFLYPQAVTCSQIFQPWLPSNLLSFFFLSAPSTPSLLPLSFLSIFFFFWAAGFCFFHISSNL